LYSKESIEHRNRRRPESFCTFWERQYNAIGQEESQGSWTMMTPMIFFSYSRQDSEFALKLGTDLRASGTTIWLDQLDIEPGERWDVAIQKALTECGRILVILSPDSVQSTNVMDEVSYALEENKVVIPVFHRDCEIPFRLRRLQHTDFRGDYQTALEKLVKHLAPGTTEGTSTRPPYTSGLSTKKPAFSSWKFLAVAAIAVVLGIWGVTAMMNSGRRAPGPGPSEGRNTGAVSRRLTVPTYVITAGAFKTEGEAQALQEKLRRDGHAASYLWIPDYPSLSGAKMFLTFIGPFADIEECRRHLAEFRKTDPSAYGILVSNEAKRVQFTR
jgi:hypothetical protein